MSPTPTRADALRNRERIIAVAAETFASEGTDVGVAEIARRAGIGNATVFRNFPTKDDLLLAVLEARIGEMTALLHDSRDSDEAAGQALYEFMCRCAELQVSDQALMETVGSRLGNHPRMLALRDEWLTQVSALLARAKAEGSIRAEIEPADLMLLLHGVASAARLGSLERNDLHRRYMTIVFAGIAPDPGGPPLEPPPPSFEEFEAAKQAAHG